MDYYDAIPPLLRGSALESRRQFPLTWAAPSAEEADRVERTLHHYLILGGMGGVINVTRRDLLLELTRP